jgi:hypothetical protein
LRRNIWLTPGITFWLCAPVLTLFWWCLMIHVIASLFMLFSFSFILSLYFWSILRHNDPFNYSALQCLSAMKMVTNLVIQFLCNGKYGQLWPTMSECIGEGLESILPKVKSMNRTMDR